MWRFWALLLVLDVAHCFAPIALVCAHKGLREIAVQRWWRCIGLPLGVFGITVFVALLTVSGFTSYDLNTPHQLWRITYLTNPLPLVVWTYWFWNAYHFGMQNFGLARLLRLPGPRWFHKLVLGGSTSAVMLAGPHFLSPLWGFVIGTLLISVGHWLTELWLTWRMIGGWAFIAGVIAVGGIGFVWAVPTSHNIAIEASGICLGLYTCRLGAGFVHFLTDRWLWKLSDPQIRVLVGPRLEVA
jgi:hypothetical protein